MTDIHSDRPPVDRPAPRTYVSVDGNTIERDGDVIVIRYIDGWVERLWNGRYSITDPNDNLVIDRLEMDGDRERFEDLARE